MNKSLVLLMALVLVGCETNLYNLDKRLSKLGITLDYQAKYDNCLKSQMSKFNSDYKANKRKQKRAIKKQLKDKYSTVVVLPTVEAQKIEGIKQTFSYVERICNSSYCFYREKATKVLEENLQVTGENPKTQVTKEGATLTIQAQFKTDYSVVKKYYTRSVEAYDKIETIEGARNSDAVWNEETQGKDRSKCGANVSLKEIL